MKLPRDLPAETSFRHWDHWGKRLRAKAEAQRHEPMSATFSMAYPLLSYAVIVSDSPPRPHIETKGNTCQTKACIQGVGRFF